jgi:RHS repeat-associated protein
MQFECGLPLTPDSRNKYQFNGEEFQEDFGLQWYDFDARFYDSQIVRTPTMDPHAENYYNESPYSFLGNNPVNNIDPDGQDYNITIDKNKKGKITGITFSETVYIKGDGASQKKANQMNAFAKVALGTKQVDGLNVRMSINYIFNKDMTPDKLDKTKGENLLTFDNENSQKDCESGYENHKVGEAGNTGVIHEGGKDKIAILHESLHMFGLDDRYTTKESIFGEKYWDDNLGFENDIMGANQDNRAHNRIPVVVKFHYEQFYKAFKTINKKNERFSKTRVDNQ